MGVFHLENTQSQKVGRHGSGIILSDLGCREGHAQTLLCVEHLCMSIVMRKILPPNKIKYLISGHDSLILKNWQNSFVKSSWNYTRLL